MNEALDREIESIVRHVERKLVEKNGAEEPQAES